VAPDPDGPGPSGASTEALAALVDVTEQIRGLEFLVDPTITVISGEDMAERVRQDLEEEIDPAEIVIDEAFFELIGILPADIDLAQAWIDLYSEQVAGFYDHETKELVVTGDSELTALGKSVVVHELVHALADQHFDLGATRDALVDEERYHEATALLALAEGEATYFQIVYFQSLPLEEQFAAAAEALEYDSSVLDSLPAWFGEDLGFPYDYGFVFVEALIALNGIAAVDQAYGRIPTTVEQIIHPEAYRTLEVSREVALPGNAILPGYDIYLEGEFGEWNLRLYLLDGVTDGDAIIASAGWGGDDHRILWNGTEVVFLYQFEGDTPRDAEELADALAESVAARMAVGNPSSDGDATTFYGDDFAWILLDGSTVYFVAASDRSAGETLAEVLTPGESGE
jgi:Zn-dependent peptidase ImmA (M78 family)